MMRPLVIWLVIAALFLCGTAAARPAAAAPASSRVEERLRSMTLEEKVGQLFMIHAYGASADDPRYASENQEIHGVSTIEQAVGKFSPGGIIYFAWTHNIENPEQIARLSNEIQRAALESAAGIPVLIAIDQEHGVVQRIGAPATEFPGSMALAATGDPGLARRAAEVTGIELGAMGINVNFAPVADVNVNPLNPVIGVRSFGDDPEDVAAFVAAQVEGFAAAGIGSAAKHFPGHGDTDVDSHSGLPLINHSRQELWSVDLVPFREAISAGVDMIMTAHIVVPALDGSGAPATMSRLILSDVLRGELGFDGVIVTDALTMAGARQTFDPERVPIEALKAGADLLLMPPDMEVAYNAVLGAVQSGEISEERIDESVRRILALKDRLGLFASPLVDIGQTLRVVGSSEHLAVAEEVAGRSITVLKDEGNRLPVDLAGAPRVPVVGWGESTTELLAAALRARGADARSIATGANPDRAAIVRAAQAARESDLVLLVTMNVAQNPAQRELAEALAGSGTDVIAVAVGMPYDVMELPFLGTVVATYGYRGVSLRALLRVLAGDAPAQGRSPVNLSGR